MRVQVGFDLSLTAPVNFFTLDDPVRGVLDNTTYVLGGVTLVDVTSDVRSVSTRRGRSRQLERFTAGNATVSLNNFGASARKYDPTNTAGPYYGSILPRTPIVVDVDGEPLFTGVVADWDFAYDVGGQSLAELSCIDALGVIAARTLTGGTATAQLTGARVGEILDQAGWPATSRTIAAGAAMLDADYIEPGTNALAYLSQVADVSEPGALFVGRAGDITFRSRTQMQAFDSSGPTFGPGGIDFIGVSVIYGTDEMVNTISVTYSAGTVVGGTATAVNQASDNVYGTLENNPPTLPTLLASAEDAQDLADWIVGSKGQPRYRFETLTVAVTALSAADAATVLALDLGDTVRVVWTPNGTGDAISRYATIDGIEHMAVPGWHEVTFNLSETIAGFILDDATFGVLDQSILGF